jgi:hypothetical protein
MMWKPGQKCWCFLRPLAWLLGKDHGLWIGCGFTSGSNDLWRPLILQAGMAFHRDPVFPIIDAFFEYRLRRADREFFNECE